MDIAEYKSLGRKPHKYGAVRTVIDGHVFSSKAEARHYGTLKLAERARRIGKLRLQPSYDIVLKGVKICRVVMDFEYREGVETVAVDVKGFDTALSRLKRKLLAAMYPNLVIRVVK